MASSQQPLSRPKLGIPLASTGKRPQSDAPTLATPTSSLAANYLPSKFTGPPSDDGIRKRNRISQKPLRKEGGGREAFRTNEARMPGANDEDYDGVDDLNIFKSSRRTLRWNKFKWTLLIVNIVVTTYSLVTLVICILTWLNVFHHADIIRVGNRPELVVSTLASATGVFTSLVGWAGILLNNRGFLAVYTFLLWITFAMSVAPGYMTDKKRTFNLEGKVRNLAWLGVRLTLTFSTD